MRSFRAGEAIGKPPKMRAATSRLHPVFRYFPGHFRAQKIARKTTESLAFTAPMG
jgi:hypothetical protein